MTASPRVAAVIVHYGDPAPTRRCLDSLAGTEAAIQDVILVDQPPSLFGEHARVTVRLEPGANLGFAAACNLGVARTGADFVLLLNNDALLAPGSASALVRNLADIGDEIAGACLKLVNLDGVTIQSAGGLWFTHDGIGYPRGFGHRDFGQYDVLAASAIGVPSGAAALYRTSAWREAGGMAEEFFCYCEDGDLGLRMVAAGGSFAWFPDVVVLHELSSSSGAHSAFKAFHVERNHFLALLHTASLPRLAALPFLTLARIANTGFDALQGRGAGAGLARDSSPVQLATTLLRAWAGAIGGSGRALRRRRDLRLAHPLAEKRVARFLASRRVGLAEFSRSRETASARDS